MKDASSLFTLHTPTPPPNKEEKPHKLPNLKKALIPGPKGVEGAWCVVHSCQVKVQLPSLPSPPPKLSLFLQLPSLPYSHLRRAQAILYYRENVYIKHQNYKRPQRQSQKNVYDMYRSLVSPLSHPLVNHSLFQDQAFEFTFRNIPRWPKIFK